jgi:Zn-dependent membrane protease YugP
MLHKDYKEMLQCLSDEGVKFLVVSACALAAHGFQHAIQDPNRGSTIGRG